MKLLFALLLVLFVVLVAAAPAAQKDAKKPLIAHGKQKRWMADDLKAHHRQMRKTHKNYIPYYPDASIFTVISIGTPAVDYWVSLESGSEALFVLAQNYPGRNTSIDQPFFDPDQSSTAKFAGDYVCFTGELQVFGAAYDDVVGLFGFGDRYNTTQQFGVVNDVYDPYFLDPAMPDGVVGLSWNPVDAANPGKNSSAILDLFKEFGDLDRYWCQWLEGIKDPQHGRKYTTNTQFGGCLDDLCDVPTAENTVPMVWIEKTRSLAFWLDAFTYKGQQLGAGFAKVDTGVPIILMPYNAFLGVFYDTNPDYDWEHGLFTVPCDNNFPDWVFTIGGNQYTVPSSACIVDLLLPNNQCALSTYMSDPETTDFVLGYPFHNLWCIKMDIDNQAISILDVLPQPR